MITRRSLFASLAGLVTVPAVAEPDIIVGVDFGANATTIVGPFGMTFNEWLHRQRVVEAFKGQWPQWAEMGRGLWAFKLHDPDKRTLIYDQLNGVSKTVDNIIWGDIEWDPTRIP